MKRKRKFSIKGKILFFLPLMVALLSSTSVYAAATAEQERTARLIFFDSHLSRQGVVVWIGRQIGWMLTCGLKWLAETLEALLNASYDLVNFTTNSKVSDFITDAQPIIIGFLTCGILFYGFCKITKEKFAPPILENLILIVIIIAASGSLFSLGNSFVKDAKKYLAIDGSISDQVVGSGIEDIYTYEYYKYKWSSIAADADGITPASNSKKIIKTVDPTETIDGGGGTSTADTNPYTGKECDRSFYDYKLMTSYNNKNGNMVFSSVEIKDTGYFEIFYDRYYRYNFNWLAMWLGLIACIIVYLLSTYKVVRISYDLVVHRMIAPFVAGADITNGKKIKQLIMSVFGNYMTLVSILVIQKAYGFLYVWINKHEFISDGTTNLMFQVVISVCLAIAVIDAPNLFEQLLGVDAGLKSAYSMLAVARGTKAVGHMAAKTAGAVAKGAASGAGLFSGMRATLGNGSNTASAAPDGGKSGAADGGSASPSSDNGNMSAASNANAEKDSPDVNTVSMSDSATPQAETDNANGMNKPKEAMTNAGNNHPNNYYISPNTLGERYRGGIGDFLKKNTRLGQAYSNAKDLGNAVTNTGERRLSQAVVLQGQNGKDGKDGAKGEKGDRGIRGRDAYEKKSSSLEDK